MKPLESTLRQRIRIYVHSDILPNSLCAGGAVLRRHFVEREDFEVAYSLGGQSRMAIFNTKMWQRAIKSRFHEQFLAVEDWANRGHPSSEIVRKAKEFNPHLVLTIAHGRGYLEAQNLADDLEIPIAAMVHDWWPDVATQSEKRQRKIEAKFLDAYKRNDLNLLVCNGMQRRLGDHPNARVLPPIPGPRIVKPIEERPRSISNKFRVCYSGNLFHYGPMLMELLKELGDNNVCELSVRGPSPAWPTSFKEKAKLEGKYLQPLKTSDELTAWMSDFDAHLCVMQFEPSARRRMETSFPSKLVDAFRFGRPIILWGPEYCSAIEWSRDKEAVFAITDPDIKVAAREITRLAMDLSLRNKLSAISAHIASTEFDADGVQRKLMDALMSIIGDQFAAVTDPLQR